ncbi:MAG TPA: class I SAM-dependent methyltransferase, partial [Byssovorax sp.]
MSPREARRPVPATPPSRVATRKGKPRDRELEVGSSAHYEDPAYYTKTYKRRLEDVRFYVGVALERGTPTLEYGCGNGRITIPIAREGGVVAGVDLSKPMLDDLARRLADEPDDVRARVTHKRGDMRAVKLGRRFDRVLLPFNALLHLYSRDDVERFCARVREHLTPRGELVFDVSVPEPTELARDPDKPHFAPRFRYPDGGDGSIVRYSERFDYDRLRQVLFVSMEFHPIDGRPTWVTPMTHRQFYPQELEALLHYNGLEVVSCDGDFYGTKPDPRSASMLVYRC